MESLAQTGLEKSTSDELSATLDSLSRNQLRFVVAMQECKTKDEAAEAIGLKPNTVYKWNGNVERAIRLLARVPVEMALEISKRALVKAMMVKVAGLDADDEGIRQKAATEIIEHNLGKPTQRQETSFPQLDEMRRLLWGDQPSGDQHQAEQ